MNKSPPAKSGHRTGVQKVTVAATEAGRRIDNFIASHLKNLPKSKIYKILRRGEVRVNGSRAKQGYRLKEGDVVRLPPVQMDAEPSAGAAIPAGAIERLLQNILYEDDGLVVLNKPAGLAVHGGSGIAYGVIDMLRAGRRDDRLELVHRLDRDTSGCLLLAKDMAVLRSLHDALRAGEIRKGYTALLKGRLQQPELNIDEPLSRQKKRAGERKVIIDAAGKPSATQIRRRQLMASATLVDVNLLTGRTHQIRVHAADAGYPLAGDEKYGDWDFNKDLRRLGLKRLFLHAARLELPDRQLTVEAPLPDDLNAVIDKLS